MSALQLIYITIRHYFPFNSHLKKLYISNKTKHLNYKSGCGLCVSRYVKEEEEESVWAIDNSFG